MCTSATTVPFSKIIGEEKDVVILKFFSWTLYDKPYQFGELVGRSLGDLAGQIGWAAGISDSIDSNKPLDKR